MLTEEREKEIRDYWIFEIYTSTAINDLLAEIDRLRAENANMRLDLEWPIVKELDALKAEIEKLKAENHRIQDNRNTWKKDSGHWYDENQRLKERIEKLRETLKELAQMGTIISVENIRYPVGLYAQDRLTQDEKEAAK